MTAASADPRVEPGDDETTRHEDDETTRHEDDDTTSVDPPPMRLDRVTSPSTIGSPDDPVAERGGDPSACGMSIHTPTTSDHLLGGRISYVQSRNGFRAAIDPILLAAAIPARAGDRVLEGGIGAGAALLCLATRVPGISGIGVDRDPGLLRLARANAVSNELDDLNFVVADLATSPIGGRFDHAFANPPYHIASGTPSPSREREAAKRSTVELLPAWVEALSRPLRHRGTLTFILPPGLLEAALKAMRERNVPAERVFPIWPRIGRPARLVVIQGRKHGRSPLVIAAGLVLHTETGAFRPDADAILRDGAALNLTGG